jgi:hypothetical protein
MTMTMTKRKSRVIPVLKDPRVFEKETNYRDPDYRRILGLDLGTNCGVAIADIMPGQIQENVCMILGIWDLSLGPYDSGPLRHIRLKQFLAVSKPDIIMYEEVKFTPSADMMKARGITGNAGAIVARVSTAAEFLGGLKVTVSTWAEEHNIPAHGLTITQIKKFATGSGRANKTDMIRTCNEKYGTTFDLAEDVWSKDGTDNIADAAHVCAMGIDLYSEGL